MSRKLLSMLLVLNMLLTMLPMLVVAQEENMNNDPREEIVAFEPIEEREKTVSVGTSLEDLELPEDLTATVRTSPDIVTGNSDGFEYEETLVDIPVTWISQPEYDMDTEDNYVFTPVIEGYTVSAELPQINVIVEAQMAPMMMLSMGAPTEVGSFTDLESFPPSLAKCSQLCPIPVLYPVKIHTPKLRPRLSACTKSASSVLHP
jgi:hypothetical protein